MSTVRSRGFTLVELLVVLVIIGTMAAVVAPALGLRPRGGARDTAERLVAVYDRARAVAVGRGVESRVTVELSTGSYSIVATPAGGASGAAPADSARTGTLGVGGGSRMVGGRDGWARMTFDAMGRGHGDPVAVVDDRARHDVVTDPWTGATRALSR